MKKADFFGNIPRKISTNMRNFCSSSVKGQPNIAMLYIGSSSFQCGWSFRVFVLFTLVGTSLLVSI
jgi:hypothetical protein